MQFRDLRNDPIESVDTMLEETAFSRLPGGAIKPGGWLKQQLRVQADGVSGHLDEFWPDVQNSAWIGGNADGWERMPRS